MGLGSGVACCSCSVGLSSYKCRILLPLPLPPSSSHSLLPSSCSRSFPPPPSAPAPCPNPSAPAPCPNPPDLWPTDAAWHIFPFHPPFPPPSFPYFLPHQIMAAMICWQLASLSPFLLDSSDPGREHCSDLDLLDGCTSAKEERCCHAPRSGGASKQVSSQRKPPSLPSSLAPSPVEPALWCC